MSHGSPIKTKMVLKVWFPDQQKPVRNAVSSPPDSYRIRNSGIRDQQSVLKTLGVTLMHTEVTELCMLCMALWSS